LTLGEGNLLFEDITFKALCQPSAFKKPSTNSLEIVNLAHFGEQEGNGAREWSDLTGKPMRVAWWTGGIIF
jgi:hypothetical protein